MVSQFIRAANSFELRSYQAAAYTEAMQALDTGKRTVMVLPTGAGKTIVARAIVHRYLGDGKRVLFVAHRRKLIQQAKDKIGGHPNFVLQTVQGFNADLGPFDLVVTDEAHHVVAETYQAIYRANPDAALLGLTATPVRGDGTGLGEDFDVMVQTTSAKHLIDEQFLAGITLFAPKEAIDTAGVGHTKGGDFSLKSLGRVVRTESTANHAVQEYIKHAIGLRGIVFCVDRAHARLQNAAYIAAGFRSVYMDGETPELDQLRIFKAWDNREIDMICNCQLFTEGLDLPEVDFVQILRPTESLPLYFQMIGRGMRPGTEPLRLLDHTLNWQNIGLPDEHGGHELYVSGFKLASGSDSPIVRNEKIRERVRNEDGEVVDTGRWIDPPELVEVARERWRAEALRLFRDQPELSNPKIAELVGVADSSIGAWRRANGFANPSPNPRASDQQKAEALRLFREQPELSNPKIAELFGVTSSTIGTWRKANGFANPSPRARASDQQKAEALRLFREQPELSNPKIAELFGVTSSTIWTWRKANGFVSPNANVKTTDQQKAEALRLFREQPELSNTEIAEMVGVTSSTIGTWRKANGFVSPSPSPRASDQQKAKALRLFRDQPELSNPKIGKLVGVASSTIGVWRKAHLATNDK
jgi:DNA repair protein RadD